MTTAIKNITVSAEQILPTLAAFAAYVTAGNATVTLYNGARGARFTFKVQVKKRRTDRGGFVADHESGIWFVSLRTASGWARFGTLSKRAGALAFRAFGAALNPDAAEAFGAQVERLNTGEEWPEHVLIWREHTCGRCGAALTSEYRLIGYGPDCCGARGIDGKAVIAALASCTDPNRAVELARDLLHGPLTQTVRATLGILPGVAGEYAAGHLRRAG